MELNSVRIPGKVMLSGEYAVLYGATAVLMPVPRFLTISESLGPSTNPSPVLEHALREPIEPIAVWEEKYPLRSVEVDRSDFYIEQDGRLIKLGIGSSAAEAVGVIALRLERAGVAWQDNRELVATLAERAHRRAQGGIGSGADVAAVAYGCPIRFNRSNDTITVDPIDTATSPVSLPLALLHSGTAANTRVLVRLFEGWACLGDRQKHQLEQLVALSDELAPFWFGGDSGVLLDMLTRFDETMSRLTDEATLPWKTTVHRDIETWAKKNGGAAKPTGAGGGDLVLTVGNLPLSERSEPRIDLQT
ncbi:hypothetical protein KQI63_06205 [bacterium]|nr:hypothetical protein [bacterium]